MKNTPLSNAHDKFFKEAFSRKEIACSFIRHYLPVQVNEQIDLTTLAILKDSFIDKDFKENYSDMLYSINFSGKKSYIYLLVEHKSYQDIFTGFQLLRNMVKVWEQYRKENEKSKILPLILPLILYQGKSPWPFTTVMGHLFANIANMEAYIPEFKREVFEVVSLGDEQITGNAMLQILLLAQKHVDSPIIATVLRKIMELYIHATPPECDRNFLESTVRYLFATTNRKRHGEIEAVLSEYARKGVVGVDSIADKLRHEGKLEGLEQGKLEGLEQGKIEGLEQGKINVAKKMIQKGMSNREISELIDLKEDEVEMIRKKQRS